MQIIFKKQIVDKLSICLSVCCILHCIALPAFILIIPSLASFWIANENVHIALVLMAIPISLFAMLKSLKKHNEYKCISLAITGLFLLVAAIFMHDIGFSSDQSLLEQKQNLHTEENSGENNRKNYDDHDHHEHDEIAETLETIFTVLGGLVLLGAHYLNIKYTNKTV